MFSFLERNPFFFTVAFLCVFAVAGLIEILPDFVKTSRPIVGLKPYNVLELAGRQVYMKEGCYNCHSQLIRSFKAETDRYGDYSKSGEYAYDRPFLWGSKRTGPDLHRVGDSKTSDWHANHMYDPQSVVPNSIMPAYKHLFTKNTDFETAYADAYTNKVIFGVPYDLNENSVKLGSIEEARDMYMNDAGIIVEEMRNNDVKEAYLRGEVKEIVALIAYMKSLGQSRRTN